MKNTKLYFIALIPGEELREEIRRLKEAFKKEYHAGHALKSPAHITLQRPFRREENFEDKLIVALTRFSTGQKSFEVRLSDFGFFEPRVVYIKITGYQKIIQLHQRLYDLLQEQLHFEKREINEKIHPHMTLATRDLEREYFYKARKVYQTAIFKRSFMAKSLFLLKHNGKYWDIYREFTFEE